MENHTHGSPFDILNIRLFIVFRSLFNARFYYPVFTILFLDFGLTLEQFALLNVAWAVSIVLLEVPSGAMADIIGRRNLLVFAGLLMVLEMALLSFAPRGNTSLLFKIFLMNRILSGAAEASASGADEALAYDTLKRQGSTEDWPRVLEWQMRVQAIAFMVAMSLGAAVYDPALMQRLVDLLGLKIQLTQGVTLRFPLFLTLMMAFGTLLTTLGMREKDGLVERGDLEQEGSRTSIIQAFKLSLGAGRWIVNTPFALVLILAGLLFDNCIRMIATLESQYYRTILLPEALFGIIASAMALLGLFVPRLARLLIENHSPLFNLGVMAGITFMGFIGLAFVWPIFGLIPVALLFSAFSLNAFFLSHYLNRITSSEQRATVLSFKGLSLNLAYGVIGLLYSLLLYNLRNRAAGTDPLLGGSELENFVFTKSLAWFPWYFAVTMAAMIVFARWRLKNSDEYKQAG